MEKFKRFCEIFIRILFSIALLAIVYVNLITFSLDNSNLFFTCFFLLIVALTIMWLYKKNIIRKSIFYGFICILLIIGIISRIYYIENISFSLTSDFKFVYDNAQNILNGSLNDSIWYLTYNGYSYLLSLFIAGLFAIFGVSVNVVLYTNIIIQLFSIYFLYKIVSLKHTKETASLVAIVFFLFPSTILANLLVSTETPFMLAFFVSIYAFYKIIDKTEITLKNFLLYALLGLILCCANYIRPVMTIFLIALLIYFIIKMKKSKEILLLIPLFGVYQISNIAITEFIEYNLGEEMRSGALGWSFYFGSNYEQCGEWSQEDADYVFDILDDPNKGDGDLILLSFDRYKDLGLVKTVELFQCKYGSLWTRNVGVFYFVDLVIDKEQTEIDFSTYYAPFNSISTILMIMLCLGSIVCMYQAQRKQQISWLFIELFGLGYILSNLLVCLNLRYNLPLVPILLICCSPWIDKFFQTESIKREPKSISRIKRKNAKILLIIPAYNEQDSIENTIEQVKKYGYDYVIINDGSKDLTELICQEKGYNYISLPHNLGIGGAVQTGYKYALQNNYDIAIQFDADGQHDIKYVESLIKPIINNEAHFVLGSRFIVKDEDNFQSTQMRRIGISLISSLIKYFSDSRIYDTTSGFRAANIDVIKRFVDNYPSEYPEPISTFELLKDNYIVKEIPVKMHERKAGNSSIVSWKKIYYMINVYLSIIIVQIRGDK